MFDPPVRARSTPSRAVFLVYFSLRVVGCERCELDIVKFTAVLLLSLAVFFSCAIIPFSLITFRSHSTADDVDNVTIENMNLFAI